MWETLHLFSRYNKNISIKGQSSEEEFVSAYPSTNAAKDSMTVVLVNRSTVATKGTILSFDNFTINNAAKSLTIKNLPASETFVSHSQNALTTSNLSVNDNSIAISLSPLSITSIQLTGKPINYIATITALEKPIDNTDFQLFPNPSQELLQVNKEGEIQVFDAKGQAIEVQQQGQQIKIGMLNEGVYFIKIIDKKGAVFSKKFVKN
jgi:membrane carboxypeptidase/penicillin-binding protein PbpC